MSISLAFIVTPEREQIYFRFSYMMGTQSFLEFHEIALPWKKIPKFYLPDIANNLRAYTREEIIKNYQ